MFRDIELTPAAPSAFITLAEAKAYLGIAGTGSDTLLTELIAAASRDLEAFCGAVFTQRSVTERMQLDVVSRSLVLRYSPVSALTSLEYDGTAETVADYRLAKDLGIVRHKEAATFGAGADWVVVYVAGFAAIPDDVKLAAKEHVKDAYNAASRNAEIARESVADVGETEYRAPSESKIAGAGGVQVSHRVASILAPYTLRYST